MKIKKILYWLTVVGPVADILKGTILGIKMALQNEKNREELERQRRLFINDHLEIKIDMED